MKLTAVDDLAIESEGDAVAGMGKLTGGDVVGPDLALAVLVTPPASRSACVTVYDAEHVRLAPGASPAAGNAGHDTDAILLSVIVIADVSVVLPLLVTL